MVTFILRTAQKKMRSLDLTERSATESNNRKVTSMVENIISGLYLVGDVALLGLLVYNRYKSADRIKQGSNDNLQKRAN
jgi:hypothetical protein